MKNMNALSIKKAIAMGMTLEIVAMLFFLIFFMFSLAVNISNTREALLGYDSIMKAIIVIILMNSFCSLLLWVFAQRNKKSVELK